MTNRLYRGISLLALAALPLVVVALFVFSLSDHSTNVVEANSTPANPGAFSFSYSFTNNTGQQATDLHVTFSAPVEKPTVTTQPPDCDVSDPLGPEVTQPSATEVAAVWSIKCIDPLAGPGGKVTVKVFTKALILQPVSVTWTNFNTPIPTLTPTSAATPTPELTATPEPDSCVDLNGDGRTTGRDVSQVARALNTAPGDRRWNPDADLDGNSIVNRADLRRVLNSLTDRACR